MELHVCRPPASPMWTPFKTVCLWPEPTSLNAAQCGRCLKMQNWGNKYNKSSNVQFSHRNKSPKGAFLMYYIQFNPGFLFHYLYCSSTVEIVVV